jgi:hypothetical protein
MLEVRLQVLLMYLKVLEFGREHVTWLAHCCWLTSVQVQYFDRYSCREGVDCHVLVTGVFSSTALVT